jgi:hypothetical protein
MRDLDRLKCIQAVVDGDSKLIKAADRLGLTTRQVRRLARRYAAQGPAGMISKRFNRRSNTYDKLGAIDQGAIVENKRLGHTVRLSSIVQANRDNRSCAGPSTAHRIDGKHVPRKRAAGSKTQRELNEKDLSSALEAMS